MRVDQSARDARAAPRPADCVSTNFASAPSGMRLTESRSWMPIRSLHRRLRFAVWWVLDRSLGVWTTSVEPSGLVQVEQDKSRYSKPSGWFTLYRVFQWLDVGPDDVMIDFGSGTGRAVLVASLFPLRRVIGVELVEPWHRCAQANLAHFRPRRRAPVELHCANALEYQVPDDITVVVLYNPFHGETFRGVVENVFASFDRAPRRLRIVYLNPQEHEYLVGTGRCRLVRRLMTGLRPSRDWARMLSAYVYEVTPAASSARHERWRGQDHGSTRMMDGMMGGGAAR
jgi:hypothetical protein